MPTEAELRRRMLAEDSTSIDAATVIRLARRRRLPRRIVLGTTVALAIVGIGVTGVFGIRGVGPMSATDSAGGSAEESATEGDDPVPAPAAPPTTCGSEFPMPRPSTTGLEVGTIFPDTASAGGGRLTGVVTLRNAGDIRVTGTTVAPVFALLRDGIVIGSGVEQAPAEPAPIDLAPGEASEYEVEVTPVACTGVESGPGDYDLIAVIGFTSDLVAASSDPPVEERLTTPPEPITLD